MVPGLTRLETVETGRWFIMSAPEPSAKPLSHNLDPGGEGGGGSEIALSKKRKTRKLSVAKLNTVSRATTSFPICD